MASRKLHLQRFSDYSPRCEMMLIAALPWPNEAAKPDVSKVLMVRVGPRYTLDLALRARDAKLQGSTVSVSEGLSDRSRSV